MPRPIQLIMKTFLIVGSMLLLSLTSCKKTIVYIKGGSSTNGNPGQSTSQFVKYSIKKGEQYCDKNVPALVEYTNLNFVVKFDSSAIYTTTLAENQYDINKLFGFSDNHAMHHEYSARFGWRWSDRALRLFAYVYNRGIMSSQEIGTVTIGSENSCQLRVLSQVYLFTLNNKSITMPRSSPEAKAVGYKLYPYFGGDETAPQNISIWIKEL